MSESSTLHTPTPWKTMIDGGRTIVWETEDDFIIVCETTDRIDIDVERANATFIVQAVNAYDALVSRVQELETEVARIREWATQELSYAAQVLDPYCDKNVWDVQCAKADLLEELLRDTKQ